QKKPNGFGLYDMHGNVQEWVVDCYHESYSIPEGASYSMRLDDHWTAYWHAHMYVGPCAYQVVRGGGWSEDPRNLRSAFRGRAVGQDTHETVGFRILRWLSDTPPDRPSE